MKIVKYLFVIGLICYSLITTGILLVEGIAFRYAIVAYEYVVPTPRPKGLTKEVKELIVKLETELDRELTITSGKRDKKGSSAHNTGKAIDIRAWTGKDRFQIIQAANKLGVNRIGVYDRHVHLDVDMTKGQNTMWIGKSK